MSLPGVSGKGFPKNLMPVYTAPGVCIAPCRAGRGQSTAQL